MAIDGAYGVGAEVGNTVKDPSGALLEMSAEVLVFVPGEELRQCGGIPGVMTFDHQWLLKPVEGGTLVVQHEVDRGLFLWIWNSSWIEPAYNEVLEALRACVVDIGKRLETLGAKCLMVV